MKTWVKVSLITLVFGLPAFFLGPILWPPHPDVHPTQFQLPFFILLSVIESLVFGLGMAFIHYGLQWVKKSSPQTKNRATAMYVSLSWLLVSWWPHDNWHIHNGLEPVGLLLIDYTFHLTLIVASLILAYNFIVMFGDSGQKSSKSK